MLITKYIEFIKEDNSNSPTFQVGEFASLKSFNQRIRYCEDNLIRLSSGSSRIVYKIDDDRVLKLAKNKKGLIQNETEIDISNDYMWDNMVTKVYNYDTNYLWIEAELARKATHKLFKDITGLDFKEYSDCLYYHESIITPKRFKTIKPKTYDDMWENEYGYNILNLIGSYDLPVGDLTRISTYGIVNRDGDDEVVMVDYGLTKDVYDNYYKRSR